MRLLRILARTLGWLLTPLVAWAASHFGGGIGASIATGFGSPWIGVAITVAASGVSAFLGLLLWTRLLRRSPELRHVLHVDEDATPDTSDILTKP